MKEKIKVFVAMSGGVDSSVAAALLKERGYDVHGITMTFEEKLSPGMKQLVKDAKGVAKKLGIPHQVIDFSSDLEKHVVAPFIQEYLEARTPNPCVRCNRLVKFGALWKKVKQLGADYLATGHYAKMHYCKKLKKYHLKKTKDGEKDQSYFLSFLNREILPSVLFPLGDITKGEVREIAVRKQLKVAHKKESQDICFIPDRAYKEFIKSRLGVAHFKPGKFVDQEGKVVGEHQGIMNYTIGQREKLGIALGRRVYVNRIDRKKNIVYIGDQEALLADGLYAKNANYLVDDFPKDSLEVGARIRYNAPEIKAWLKTLANKRVKLIFKKPQPSVTPGQYVVFYKKDIVLGGAVIEKAIKKG